MPFSFSTPPPFFFKLNFILILFLIMGFSFIFQVDLVSTIHIADKVYVCLPEFGLVFPFSNLNSSLLPLLVL